MKIDLTMRDIELLLFLINSAALEDFNARRPFSFSAEELALIDKLENALRREETADGEILLPETGGRYH